jgi:hypothetical protein
MRDMRPTDCSKIARAMGKLDLQDEDLCVILVDALKVFLPDSPPIAVAGVMAGLGQVSYRYCTRQCVCWPRLHIAARGCAPRWRMYAWV